MSFGHAFDGVHRGAKKLDTPLASSGYARATRKMNPVRARLDQPGSAPETAMDFIEDAKRVATQAIPGPGTPDADRRAFDAMPMAELAALWCSLQYRGLRDTTPEIWSAVLYFDHLAHEEPERALELVLAVLRSEAHWRVKMQLNDKLMPVLLGHGERLLGAFETEASTSPALRWLLGGIYRWAPEALEQRFEAIADEAGWRTDAAARDAAPAPIDFARLTIPELARVWLDQHCKPVKDRDANFAVLSDYEYDLKEGDPDRLFDLVLEILRIEHNPSVLSFLAAGPLEDIVSLDTIERIEREAAESEAFCALLGGVWYYNVQPELKARLDAIIEGAHGRNWRS